MTAASNEIVIKARDREKITKCRRQSSGKTGLRRGRAFRIPTELALSGGKHTINVSLPSLRSRHRCRLMSSAEPSIAADRPQAAGGWI